MRRIKPSDFDDRRKGTIGRDTATLRHIERIRNTCVHFNGAIINEACNAGVNYHEMMGTGTGCFAHLPCLRDDGAMVSCELVKFPSALEAVAQCRREDEDVNDFMFCVAAAKADAQSKGLGFAHGGAGSIPCPKCGTGVLRYRVVSTNGHMYGTCTTMGCVRWVE